MSTKIPVQQMKPAKRVFSKKGLNLVDLLRKSQQIYVKEIRAFFQRIRTFPSLLALMGNVFFCSQLADA